MGDPHRMGGTLTVDPDANIYPDVEIDVSANVTIERGVDISAGVVIYTHRHNMSSVQARRTRRKHRAAPLRICSGAYIGAKAMILPQCNRIGHNTIIGAGSVVTKDIPDNEVWAGNPATRIKIRDESMLGYEWMADLYDDVWRHMGGVKPHHRKLHKLVAKYVPKTGHIVDIGCGTGEMLARLKTPGRTLTGFDFSSVALGLAAKRTDAELILGDIHDHDFTGYDFAVMTEVLEHIIEPPKYLPDKWVASVPLGPTVAENHVRVYETPQDAVDLHGGVVLETTDKFIIFGAL